MSSDAALLAAAIVLAVASPVAARAQTPPPPSRSSPVYLSRADFAFGWQKLGTSDRRFDWLAQVGFELDVVDAGDVRLTLEGDYEAVIGRERRRYDVNSGNYYFELAAVRRMGVVEVMAVAEHVSRHLVDRENAPAISWNEVAGRIRYAPTPGFSAEMEVGLPWDQAYVDYTWTSRLRMAYERPLDGRATVFASAAGSVIGTDDPSRPKGSICGARIEGGIRLAGHAAAIDLFASYERRIDAFPTERSRGRWFSVGFRIASR